MPIKNWTNHPAAPPKDDSITHKVWAEDLEVISDKIEDGTDGVNTQQLQIGGNLVISSARDVTAEGGTFAGPVDAQSLLIGNVATIDANRNVTAASGTFTSTQSLKLGSNTNVQDQTIEFLTNHANNPKVLYDYIKNKLYYIRRGETQKRLLGGLEGIIDASEYPTIQDAINAIDVTTHILYIPPGTYSEATITPKNGLRIVGAGMGETIIQLPDAVSPLTKILFDARGKNDIRVSNLTFDGNIAGNPSYTGDPVQTNGGQRQKYEFCEFKNSPYNVMFSITAYNGVPAREIDLIDCWFHDNKYMAIWCHPDTQTQTYYPERIRLLGCIFTQNNNAAGDYPCVAWGCKFSEISNTIFYDNGNLGGGALACGLGTNHAEMRHNIISHNLFYDNGKSTNPLATVTGIEIASSGHNIMGNVVVNNNACGIFIYGNRNTISGNYILNNNAKNITDSGSLPFTNGITLDGSLGAQGVTCSNNYIANNYITDTRGTKQQGYGIQEISGANYNVIIDNYTKGNLLGDQVVKLGANTIVFHVGNTSFVQSAPPAAPADAEIFKGGLSFYLDEPGATVKVRARKADGTYFTNTVGDGDSFTNIAVTGQSTVVADSSADTLTLVAGSGMTITTDASTDTITFVSSGAGGGGWTDTGTQIELTTTSDRVKIGDTTDISFPSLAASKLSVQTSGSENDMWLVCAHSVVRARLSSATSRGTLASPTALQNGDDMFVIGGYGHDGTSWQLGSAAVLIHMEAAGTWSGSSRPTQITFGTTPVNSTAREARLFIDNTGGIGIGTVTPNASALVDLTSTTQGFLPPRGTVAQRNAISSPVAGLIFFTTDGIGTTNKLNVYNGSAWEVITST